MIMTIVASHLILIFQGTLDGASPVFSSTAVLYRRGRLCRCLLGQGPRGILLVLLGQGPQGILRQVHDIMIPSDVFLEHSRLASLSIHRVSRHEI